MAQITAPVQDQPEVTPPAMPELVEGKSGLLAEIPAECVLLRMDHEDPTSWHAPSLQYQDSQDKIRIASSILNSLEDYEDRAENSDGGYGTVRLDFRGDTYVAGKIGSVTVDALALGVKVGRYAEVTTDFAEVLQNVDDNFTDEELALVDFDAMEAAASDYQLTAEGSLIYVG